MNPTDALASNLAERTVAPKERTEHRRVTTVRELLGSSTRAIGMGTQPVIRDREAVEYEPVEAATGLTKGVLLDESDGTPTFVLRRFTLDAGASVPRHTNEVEHVQYVLAGEYVVGIEGTAAMTISRRENTAFVQVTAC